MKRLEVKKNLNWPLMAIEVHGHLARCHQEKTLYNNPSEFKLVLPQTDFLREAI